MKKKLLPLVGAMLLALTIGACTAKGSNTNPDDGGGSEVVTKYTITFYVEGERYATKKVEEGQHITGVTNPTKEGYKFVCWLEDETPVDLETYVVSKDARFDASFEVDEGDVLSVDDVKEEGKDYYLVMGWWEDSDSDTGTSGLTKPLVRMFYQNLINYLKATGATDENIANMQFRNYSSVDVDALGNMLRADADVDIVVGVGGNINEDPAVTGKAGANVPLYDSNNDDYKFKTTMGAKNANRTVACLQYASELGASVYHWLATETGKASFVRELTAQEIEDSIPHAINLTVTIHGATNVTTVLENSTDVIEMPTITVPEGMVFTGFATTADAETAELEVGLNAELTYNDVKALVAEGATTLDLYPVFAVQENDLVVYVQTGSNLSDAEAHLLELRFKETLTDEVVKFDFHNAGASDYRTYIEAKTDADVVIGGNDPLKYLTLKDATNYPLTNGGAKHFVSTNRKVAIVNTVAPDHLDLAKDLFDFVTAEAPKYTLKAAFWPQGKKSAVWVTEEEKNNVMIGMGGQLKTYLNVTGEETLLSKYNVEIDGQFMTSADFGVAGYAESSLTFGADLIIGCGTNIDTTAGYEGVPFKAVPTTMIAAGRQVAIPHDNCLTRTIYDNYFVAA
jgi:hypothetical protein